jgi:coenzyme PQQ precursor peptide PqqA
LATLVGSTYNSAQAGAEIVPVGNGIYLIFGETNMKVWTRPDFEEVNLGCEINCYAPAER